MCAKMVSRLLNERQKKGATACESRQLETELKLLRKKLQMMSHRLFEFDLLTEHHLKAICQFKARMEEFAISEIKESYNIQSQGDINFFLL